MTVQYTSLILYLKRADIRLDENVAWGNYFILKNYSIFFNIITGVQNRRLSKRPKGLFSSGCVP